MGEAEYAVVETGDGTVTCRTVDYDATPIKTRLRDAGVPVAWW
jgi:hypothetical protein